MDPYANLEKRYCAPHGKDDNIIATHRSQKAVKRPERLAALEDTGHALTPEQQAQIGFEICG